jgi:membrane protease YdiL (CAAX protease family)
MQAINRKRIILASPILVVIIGYLAAQFFTAFLDQWAWVGVFIVYWGCMLFIIGVFGSKERPRTWFGKPQGSLWWLFLAVAMGLVAFPIFLFPNIQVMKSIPLVIVWFAFAVINSICEEIYWRGFLLDETSDLPRTISVVYSSIFFIAVHPIVFGVFSRIQSFDPTRPLALLPFIVILIMLSLVYCLLYFKTHSLRWSILSHFLTDLGNLSIFLFMNMISF